VPQVIPETAEEKKLFETAPQRAEERKQHRRSSRELANSLTAKRSWEIY
jgi:hypothetical protein